MSNQIDDLMIMGMAFTQSQLEDLREAINVAVSTFEDGRIDSNMALQDRLIAIRKRIDYMIQRKIQFKDTIKF